MRNNKNEVSKPSNQTTLSISGMHCTSCAFNIEKVLKDTPGVLFAKVNFDNSLATLDYDESKIEIKEIENVIQKLGYKVIKN